jgi:hypothetical protein
MIEPIRSLSVDVLPQAIINMPIELVVGSRADVRRDADDLDYFDGASFKLNRTIEIAVRHYDGHPKDTTTLYIDRRERNVEQITRLIRVILEELHVPEKALQWERRNDPDL